MWRPWRGRWKTRARNGNFDPETGECWPEPDLGDVPEHWLPISPLSSQEAWSLREGFAHSIQDATLQAGLLRALGGRGAFARFREAVDADASTCTAWHAFHDAHMRQQAIQWLNDHGVALPHSAVE
jgi:hypothetical protein